MKSKVIFALLVMCLACVLAIPASADQPGANEDPFGGLSIGNGSVQDGIGIVAKFGLSPFGYSLPGGMPSRLSGDGTTPRRAIYIGGIWSGNSWDPVELPNCAIVRIPAGKARWFKLDSWEDRRTRVWLDDELDTAKAPSGAAVFGAANAYMYGTAPGDAWQTNALDGGVPSANFLEGFVMAIYGPDSLKPMWAFSAPNAALLSVNVDDKGLILPGPDGVTVQDATGAGIIGFANHNASQPGHLLWAEGRFEGWVFLMVYNQMIWDGTASVCSQRVR